MDMKEEGETFMQDCLNELFKPKTPRDRYLEIDWNLTKVVCRIEDAITNEILNRSSDTIREEEDLQVVARVPYEVAKQFEKELMNVYLDQDWKKVIISRHSETNNTFVELWW